MGKQSIRENKTVYQLCREDAGLTREGASQKMAAVPAQRIERIEYEMREPTPYDIVQMAEAYNHPELCNYYCSQKCDIGVRYVSEIKISELPEIILETIGSLNEVDELSKHLIKIGRDGKITDDEIQDFAKISYNLDAVSLAIDTLNLWVEKTANENKLNLQLLKQEKEKLRRQK